MIVVELLREIHNRIIVISKIFQYFPVVKMKKVIWKDRHFLSSRFSVYLFDFSAQ